MGACGADCGITRVREREKRAALVLAERIHPGLVWRRPSSLVTPGVHFDSVVALARRLEEHLPVRAIVRASDAGGPDCIYLLAGLHEPALCEIAEQKAIAPGEVVVPRETYLRV